MLIKGFESASNGMKALIDQNDSTANNIANVNTVGFKKQNLAFQNIYNANVVQKSAQTGEFRSIGELSIGNQVQKLTHDFSQGIISRTENTFDLAIAGDGFFKIQSSGGETSYTRNGSFTMNNDGMLVTKDGDYVIDDKGKRIKIKTNDVVMHSINDIIINEDGQIELNNENNRVTMQKVGVYDFPNKEDMQNIGGSKFIPTDFNRDKEIQIKKSTIQQGAIELSNVNVVREMISTINTTRNYEALSHVVKNNADSLAKVMEIGKL